MDGEGYQRIAFEYAHRHGAVGDFFKAREAIVATFVEERELMIGLRKEVHAQNVAQIKEMAREREERLRRLPLSYSGERVALLREVDALAREQRAERRSLVNDVSRLSREMHAKLEEYLELKHLDDAISPRVRPAVAAYA